MKQPVDDNFPTDEADETKTINGEKVSVNRAQKLSFDKIKNAANKCHEKLGNSEWNIGTAQAYLKKIV